MSITNWVRYACLWLSIGCVYNSHGNTAAVIAWASAAVLWIALIFSCAELEILRSIE